MGVEVLARSVKRLLGRSHSASGRDWSVPDSHFVKAPRERLTVRAVAITDQVFWRAVPWERLSDLARNPFGRGMSGHVDRHVGTDEIEASPDALARQAHGLVVVAREIRCPYWDRIGPSSEFLALQLRDEAQSEFAGL